MRWPDGHMCRAGLGDSYNWPCDEHYGARSFRRFSYGIVSTETPHACARGFLGNTLVSFSKTHLSTRAILSRPIVLCLAFFQDATRDHHLRALAAVVGAAHLDFTAHPHFFFHCTAHSPAFAALHIASSAWGNFSAVNMMWCGGRRICMRFTSIKAVLVSAIPPPIKRSRLSSPTSHFHSLVETS